MATKESHRDEKSSASRWFSPDLVRDEEIVLRTIFDPHHVESGTLSIAAVSLSDLRSRGWSVDRKKYTSLWKLKLNQLRWHHRKPDLHRCYVIPINVGTLRDYKTDNNQIFSIIDLAFCLNPAHAAILLSVKGGDGAARKARDTLMAGLPAYIDVSKAFSNEDRWGWSRGMFLQVIAILRALFLCFFYRAKLKLTS